MPRPAKSRIVNQPPLFTEFKPAGVENRLLDQVTMTIDEFEAIRLADYLSLSHQEAAERMGISRPTFTRLLDSARAKIAQMLVEGKRLVIQGGNVDFRFFLVRCADCGHTFRVTPGQNIEKCPACGSDNLIMIGPRSWPRKGRRRRWRGGRGF